jgi:hypothetical protein
MCTNAYGHAHPAIWQHIAKYGTVFAAQEVTR